MKLNKYRVTNFRSVEDSGWIECDNVTTLVGVNESGKSNLLLALWKLNPAREGKIDPLHDLPVSKLIVLRDDLENQKFITAQFILDDNDAKVISEKAQTTCSAGVGVVISRFYDGKYNLEFDRELEPIQEVADSEEFDKDVWKNNLNQIILGEMPKFVYYSNYGNLSTRIYLPNVIKWLNNERVDGIDMNEDQVRTLRVLFEFVGLNPKEILELGQDPKVVAMQRTGYRSSMPTVEEIEKAQNDKEERSILLQSASNRLSNQFKDWWNQGEYKFRFEADGDYFKIWVSDKVRADEVALELRSTGLQWFLSFYLIFLVESSEQHKNAVLLLDEAGLTLHPLAQKDLCVFFDSLSKSNQIINTTHSPFIVDTTNIDRCRVVFMDDKGFTVASSDLRQGADCLNQKSIYAVHAAMGLSVSDILLQGCQNVVVEGPSDQFYLNAIKTFLIKEKLIAPSREIVFVPSGGVKGVPGVVSILCGKTEELPCVVVDSDCMGKDAVKKLQNGLYKDYQKQIIQIKDIVGYDESEVEDIIPITLLQRGINKLFNQVEEENFEDVYKEGQPILPQLEAFAKKHNVELKLGWKVELAKTVKAALKLKTKAQIDEPIRDVWVSLFKKF